MGYHDYARVATERRVLSNSYLTSSAHGTPVPVVRLRVQASKLVAGTALLVAATMAVAELSSLSGTSVQKPALYDTGKNAVPGGGQCVNEGDFAIGNHCVKLGGAALDTFQVGLALHHRPAALYQIC